MLRLITTQCPWCDKVIHAVESFGVVQGECSVCADVFEVPTEIPMPIGATQCYDEVQHG